MKIDLHVQEPYFTDIKNGSKTFEGRLAKEKYRNLKLGDTIVFTNGEEKISKEVSSIHLFNSFADGGRILGVDCIVPGASSVSELTSIYRKFYSEEKEKEFGVSYIGLK